MGLTIEQARALTDRLLAELERRRPEVELASHYYRGDHPLRYASSEFREYFGRRYEKFSDNWVGVVADAPVERLTVNGVQPYGAQKADAESWRVWMENGCDADSQLAFLSSITGARAFGLVWATPGDEENPVVTFESADQAIVAYRAGSRRERVAGLKSWNDGSVSYATLYTADEVWKFERPTYSGLREANMVGIEDAIRTWVLREVDEPNPQPNPMGVVPLVELPNKPSLNDDPISDVSGTIAMQDSINFIWALLFNAADFASFTQRIVLGAERPTTPILDENGQVIGERPVPLEKFAVDRVLWVSDPNAKIEHWPATDLSAYTNVLEVQVGHVAAQTRTPSHYLIGKISNLSADALVAAETGLVKRCEEKQLWFGAGLREMFRLIALAQGDEAKAKAIAAGTVLWANVESRSEAQLADALLKLRQIGFPFQYLAARFGLNPTEIADVMAMKQAEAEIDPLSAAMLGKPDPAPPDGQPIPPDGVPQQ